ncbi:gamma-glutamylcyclotransferase-like [Portunus trituberculatus]|uniref:gamma-glutamylcyclotransferase-like n=1 Tax=Portunus trituberculatus TaxID=210409 RepID=UPI001E1CDAF6|nr:gamma-glutamylcyclotransferase-like [Portunus trituberculatus]XP_045101681.1 gamma-glutamylcyclotransferase-like [Portunus trituberculatus]
MAEDQRKNLRRTCKYVAPVLICAISLILHSSGILVFPKMSLSHVAKMAQHNCFLYFAYGSNLLKERIHINNPSARMIGVGKLKDYRLDFNHFSKRWKGAAATIVEDPGSYVYGVVWELANEDMVNLDRQEGVHQKIYRAMDVKVETEKGDHVEARSYQIIRPLEDDRRPSYVYMDVIIRGAKANGLPEDYIKFLESIEHNGYKGSVEINLQLDKH